jgi:hypothetical protein
VVSAVQAYGAVAPKRQSSDRRFMTVISAAAVAMALTALVLVVSGPADQSVSAVEQQWTNLADPQRVALAQALMQGNSAIKTAITTKLQEETPTDGAAEPLHEPGFVIATTDDSSPPPVRPLPAQ